MSVSINSSNLVTMINSAINLAEDLGSKLKQNKLNMATAESCTGGLVSAMITEVPGSSSWFLQGWVTYTNESKTKELDVPAELIIKYGAVSQEVVTAMAEGALVKSGADIAIATSGIAGPDGGSLSKPVGTVWIAIVIKKNNSMLIDTQCLNLTGSRNDVRLKTVEKVLEQVILKI